jgi:hypothetical protein
MTAGTSSVRPWGVTDWHNDSAVIGGSHTCVLHVCYMCATCVLHVCSVYAVASIFRTVTCRTLSQEVETLLLRSVEQVEQLSRESTMRRPGKSGEVMDQVVVPATDRT